MPSVLHEALILLFRNRPALAAELLRDVLHVDLPAFKEARIGSADLTEMQPAEYHADLVIELIDDGPVGGVVLEVQRSPDEDKRLSWPSYAAILRARLKREVCVLVVTPEESVARWASRPIASVALRASVALDPDRSRLYCDLILASLGEATRRELQTMDPAKYVFQSDFAKHYIALGKEEGRAEGRAEIVKRQLALRFGALTPDATARVSAASMEQLDAIAERLLTAPTLEEALRID